MIAAASFWVAISLLGQAQVESKSTDPVYRDRYASAAIDNENHTQNEGGSDGEGLCVIASVYTLGKQYGIDLSAVWEEAKRQPGGYYPEKFDALMKKVAPDVKYAHYLGKDYRVLVELSNRNLAIGITMDTGELYEFQQISHMLNGEHFDEDIAMFVDNNEPGVHRTVSAKEWMRRATLNNGQFWVLALVKPKPRYDLLIVAFLGVMVLYKHQQKDGVVHETAWI